MFNVVNGFNSILPDPPPIIEVESLQQNCSITSITLSPTVVGVISINSLSHTTNIDNNSIGVFYDISVEDLSSSSLIGNLSVNEDLSVYVAGVVHSLSLQEPTLVSQGTVSVNTLSSTQQLHLVQFDIIPDLWVFRITYKDDGYPTSL